MEQTDELGAFYRQVDKSAATLEDIHKDRLHCAVGCKDCCVDDISVFMIEADNIRLHFSELLNTEPPHAPGACAFLDDKGACRIYSQRPYVCRTQGLPLRWLEETESGWVELRDICPLNDEGTPVETLPPEQCWSIGAYEQKLAEMQIKYYNNLQRVDLRSLFL